ncbi:hypothetical protein [Facklamia sp. 7083-14-GEN3]|uniref:hypothetical protein n=1 Tax=Facklamia sp. 7083-14-GEN3 TaxID=2973478 RepID=UPI00215C148A|nr:hypothetical protein [Facklamia sp. 7083-14-GEN3]MCR8969540.1 hypothetical protein [Facklamia sp. 7083-14-GEN3]
MLLSFFVITIDSPSTEAKASNYHRLSSPVETKTVKNPSDQQTTSVEKPKDEPTTTQEVIAPTPPITYDPDEITQTSRQSSRDESTITTAQITTVISDNDSNSQENTTTQEKINPSESARQSTTSIEKVFEAGKLTVVKKGTVPLEYILTEFATHLYENSDLVQNLYYQGIFLIRHLLIIPDADVFTLFDHKIIQWLNLYTEYFMQNKIIL